MNKPTVCSTKRLENDVEKGSQVELNQYVLQFSLKFQ